MVIDSTLRIWGFALTTTLVALLGAELMNFVVFPDILLPYTMPATAILVVVICMPICLWGGMKMRENVMLSLELQRLVNRDRLTDVATRDFFFERLSMTPNAYGVSLMVDIDHFKEINDNFGHMAGDAVIHSVAQIMRAHVREKDIVCRFGGEEFVVFLYDAKGEDGWRIAERIRADIEQTSLTTDDGEVKVTVSVGGSLKDRIEHVDEAIKRADDCMYRAKQQGRNRTIVDWDPLETAIQAAC